MYQTGTFTTVAGLKSTIESFCTANGWTLASGVLYKGLSFIKLTNPDSYRLQITGANSVDFLTTPCPFAQTLYLLAEELPATYYLFVHADPDLCVCVVNYSSVKIQVLMFGDIVKINSSAYIGGNFFYASRSELHYDNVPCIFQINDTDIEESQPGTVSVNDRRGTFMPFVTNPPAIVGSGNIYLSSGLHAEIDGHIWDTDNGEEIIKTNHHVMLTESSISSYHRSPNQWDSQAHLIPMHLQFRMEDSLWGYLGYVEHIRLIRIDNYNIGDIVEIAPDSWKVFPWTLKEMTKPNGAGGATVTESMALLSSGSLGFAVRYDV